jgi:diamine N-acetyltransferase
MDAVAYRTCGIREIELIRPLWEQLNEHHHGKATWFKSHYARMNFEDRKSRFRKIHETGQLRLDLATDTSTGHCIGYCISSVSGEMTGEVESLFVDRAYRSSGIGTALLTRGLSWMESQGAVRKRVSVGSGNEAAWAFYRKFGFYPRMTILEQRPETE